MKAADLDLRELLSFEPRGGLIRFGGERALLFDAVSIGCLRKELIDSLGVERASSVLARFGYAHGWRTAETLRHQFPWDDEAEWQHAGGRLHTLLGLVIVRAPGAADAQLVGNSVWVDSYEAEQHRLHMGQARTTVCWTLTGFASGYLSRVYGREIHAREEACRGRGDAACRLVAKPREEWDAAAESDPSWGGQGVEATLLQLAAGLAGLEGRREDAPRGHIPPSLARGAGLVAHSAAMLRVLDLAQRVARVDSTALVTGESGVGKERVARVIHEGSSRATGPFLALNCGALPDTLLDSELFGHARGSFTGASHDRPGMFEAAGGGTLLLDEVGELSPGTQVKLLRALQEREVRRVGENRTRRVDVRILAATNRELLADVDAGRFRRDLYYRLRVIEIHVPPLRERREDILPLARAALRVAGERARRAVHGFTPAAAQCLTRYDWPGNVRELENAVERAVALAPGSRIDADSLPDEVRSPAPLPGPAGSARPLQDVERDYIMAVLRANGGNKVRTATQLQIATSTLYRKLEQYATPAGTGGDRAP